MGLSSDLLSQFVKITNDKPKTQNETTVYGTVVYDGRAYVKLDGSDLLTPVTTTTNVQDGERVTVMIKNHEAIVTGNVSSPAARTGDVEEVADQVSEFEIVMAYKVTTEDLEAANATIESLRAKLANITELEAVYAEIDNLQAKFASLEHVNADDITALNASIESIQAMFGDFTDISAEDLEALNAEITTLKGYTADFTYVSAEVLEAVKASIKELETKKLSAEEADIKYATIDFANIGQAAIDKFFAESGIIQNVTISEGVVVKELVGVVIKGDLIEANTVVVDKLVVRGSDGNYYKLSTDFTAMPGVEPLEEDSIHGSTIVAQSVTAEKVSVDDLVAFGATIGGFVITDKALHSLVKASVDNSTPGIYLDNDGQMSIGDGSDYFRYRISDTRYEVKQNEDGEYIVLGEIAESIRIDSDEEPLLPGGVYLVTLIDGSEAYCTIYNSKLVEVEKVDTRKIEIAAESILIGSSKKSTEYVKIGIVKDETGNEKTCIELAEGDSKRKQVITSDGTVLMDGGTEKTIIDTEGVTGDTIKANRTFEQCGFVWAGRSNGNYGLSWKG